MYIIETDSGSVILSDDYDKNLGMKLFVVLLNTKRKIRDVNHPYLMNA